MYYEVYIPSPEPDGFDVTITVDAQNWMSALKSGLERTGEGAEAVRNVMCDIKDDNSIHVTDATTQRVFVLEELGEELPDDVVVGEPEESEDPPDTLKMDAVEGEEPDGDTTEMPPPTPDEVAPPVAPKESGRQTAPERPQAKDPELETESARVDESLEEDSWTRDEDDFEVGSSRVEDLQDLDESEAEVIDEQRERSDVHRAQQVGRQDESVSESLIEDVFLEIQPIHEGDMGMEECVNFVIDLAMEKIEADSGSILFADTSGTELYFATARGPKANEVMDFRVPMGQGIVGFCAKEGVSLAVGDAQNDPRFYEEISESLGYETDSLLCAPVQFQGRVYGAVELINKRSGSSFTSNEMNALSYIGRQLAEYVNRVVMSQESIED